MDRTEEHDFAGCNMDCFNCPYPDCYAPERYIRSITNQPRERIVWTSEKLGYISQHVDMTPARIGRHFGVSGQTIRNLFRKYPEIKKARERRHELSVQS